MAYITTSPAGSFSAPRPALIKTALRIAALWRSRRALAQLDAAQLDDIGISAKAAAKEARRAPWDAPQNWLR
jgi:uncharacterized protein YjiS (DUF1127 family)